jgi:putative oxidoreductase
MAIPPAARDLAILIARIGVGVVFTAHGWQKLVSNGVEGSAASFKKAGVPLPTVSAWYATLVELVGGVALIVGLAVPVAGFLLVLDMLGAYLFVHAGKGIFIANGGAELVIGLGAACLLLTAISAGRFSLDHLILYRRRRQPRSLAAADPAA